MTAIAGAGGGIQVETKYIPPPEPYLPALGLQVTQLTGSYMVWVGVTEESAENAQLVPLRGFLLKDWACAMPPGPNVAIPPAATSLYRASSSDTALPMAQRLARRFKKQIFLSVDVPPSFMAMGDGPKVLLAIERAVVEELKSLESA
ncbi:hypothetical protein K474DRAFT_1688402 [Panus rudis PR-1116 ss-1]|nr:hypothetical protein K474DRAFT_1688402 [Panus rudis PR-1116 ss-1]